MNRTLKLDTGQLLGCLGSAVDLYVRWESRAQGLKTQLQRLMGLRNLFVLFTSGDDPETGKPWCPDCIRANPAVEQAFAAVEGATLLVCQVGHWYHSLGISLGFR